MISVLYVDDEPDLLELAKIFLEQTGEFRIGTSISAQEALDSLSIRPYDAIVSDYQMPGMDGIGFLKTVRERFGDIPYILFTGRGREEVAIEALNNGADFYIQKGGDPKAQFVELATKIHYAVSRKRAEQELRRKNDELNASYEQITASDEELRGQYEELTRSERRIRESEIKFRELFEKTHDALVLFTREGCIDCNQQAVDLFGYSSREELLGLMPPGVSPPFQPDGQDSKAASEARIRTVIDTGKDHFEWLQQRKDGSTFFADVLLSAFELEGRQVFLSSIRDISGRKQMEDELQLLKTSVDRSTDEVFWMDFNGSILYVNDAACRITGYSRDELCAMKIFGLDPDFPPEIWEQSVADLRQKKAQFITTRHRRKDGAILDVEIVAVYVNKDNREYSFAFVRDITERMRNERSRQDTISFLNALIEQNPNSMWISDEKGFLIRMNPACCRLLHSTEEELAGKYNVLNDNIVEEQGFMPLVRSVFEEGKIVSFPLVYDSSRLSTLPLKETVSIVLEVTIFPIKDTAGTFTNAVIIHNDITERMRAERILAESEERYRSLVNSSFDGIAIHQDGILVYVNQTAARLLGADDPAFFIGKTALEIVHPDDRARIADRIRQSPDMPMELIHERFLRADGIPVDVDVATSPCTWQGKPASYVTFRDISEQKRAENALRENEEKYRALIETTGTGFVSIDEQGRVLDANQNYVRMTGHTGFAEISGRSVIEWTAPYDREKNVTAVALCLRDNRIRNFEIDYMDPKGQVIPVEINATVVGDASSRRILTLVRDISRRRHDQQLLRESEEKFRTLVETSSDFIWEVDARGIYTYISPKIRDILGLDPGEVIGKTPFDLMLPEDVTRVAAEFNHFVEARQPFAAIENANIHKDGTTVILETSGVPWFFPDGTFAGYRGIDRDITARKKVEDALRESEEKFRILVEVNQDIVYSLDPDGTVLYMSPQTTDQIGYLPEEMEGRSFTEFIHPDDVDKLVRNIQENPQIGSPTPSDQFRVRRKDGIYRWYEDKTINAIDHRGRKVIIGTIRDITERKTTDEALFNSRQMLQTVLDTIPQRVFWKDKNSVFLGCNKPNALDAGFPDPSDMVGRTDYDYTTAEIADLYRADDRKVMETGKGRINYEEPQVRPDGSKAWLRTSKVPLYDKEGQVIGVLGTYEDITERKLAEHEIQQSRDMFRAFIDHSYEAIIIHDLDGRVLDVNATMLSMYRISRQEALTLTIADLSGPDNYREEGSAELWREVLAGKDKLFPWQARRPGDGSLFDVEVFLTRIIIGDQGIILANVRDVTERKLVEAALRQSREEYKRIFESFVDIYYETDKDGIIRVISPSVFALSGWRPEELIGNSILILYENPPDRRALLEQMEHNPELSGFEVLLKKRDGTPLRVSVNARRRYTASGEPDGILGSLRDITENITARKALQASEEKYRNILESMQDAYIRTDRDGRITMVNPSAARMYGYNSAEEMIGLPAASLYSTPGQREKMLNKLQDCGGVTDFNGEGRRKDGKTFWVSLNVKFIYSDDGSIAGTDGIIRDITERKTMEQAIHEVNRKLNLLNSITRHDVANQLTILEGYAQLAEMKNPDPVVSDFLSKIEASVEAITRQIEFTREYQDLGINSPEWFRLDDTVAKAGGAQITFSNTCRNTEVFADPMLERVFFNIFDNARRHGEHVTEIAVRCERAPDGFVIIIEDDGVGIAPEEKEKIFEKGYGKNTGLGLFLTKEILAITGITIRETGYLGIGARFEITVPAGKWRVAETHGKDE